MKNVHYSELVEVHEENSHSPTKKRMYIAAMHFFFFQ